MKCFIDSSAWFAVANSRDRFNGEMKAVLTRVEQAVTTDLVVAETWRLICHNVGWAAAEMFWERMRSGAVGLEKVGPVDLDMAWEIGRRYADQEFSLTDRASFAVMIRCRILKVATLDSDFSVFRYGKNQAFEVQR